MSIRAVMNGRKRAVGGRLTEQAPGGMTIPLFLWKTTMFPVASSFGSAAVRLVSLTRHFAPPARAEFTFVGKRSSVFIALLE